MDRFLLFDGNCAACTPVARAIEELAVPGLATRSIRDPELLDLLSSAGIEVPDRPAVLRVDGGRLSLVTGLVLRLELARLLGSRRARHIVGLAVMEVKARRARAGGGTAWSRRRILGAAATGAAAGIALGGARASGAAPGGAGVRPAQPAQVDRLIRADGVRESVRAFGPIRPDRAVEVPHAVEPVLALTHEDGVTVTVVSTATDRKRVAVVMRALTGDTRGIEFFATSGSPLGQLVVSDGAVVGRVADPGVTPDVSFPGAAELRCFVTCLGGEVSVGCVLDCVGCAGGGFGAIISCPRCALCAGPAAVGCARSCF